MGPRIKYIRGCARFLLKRHGIKEPPVDLESLVRKEGLEYQEVDYFDDDVDALIISYGDRVIAAVNKNHHLHRRRFSLAHELCHHLYHADRSVFDEKMTIDSGGDESYTSKKDPFEAEADIFASELLMPLAFLKVVCDKRTVDEVAAIFQVSTQAASVAISNHFSALYKM
jgi:Zn-dependent peptidase ImmA (M78 family)